LIDLFRSMYRGRVTAGPDSIPGFRRVAAELPTRIGFLLDRIGHEAGLAREAG
jgi:hypothetical protein